VSTLTTPMGLGKAQDPDNARDYLVVTLGAALDILATHDHSGDANPVKRINAGNTASRPAAGTPGGVYVDTVTGALNVDNGSSWAASMLNGGPVSVGIGAAANPLVDLLVGGTIQAANNGDVLYGLKVAPTFDDNAKTGVTHVGLQVQSGGVTVTAGGLTITAGGATVTAGGLTVQSGNVGIGVGAASTVGLDVAGDVGNGVAQDGIRVRFTANATATNQVIGVESQPLTAAGSYTIGTIAALFARAPVRAAGVSFGNAYGLLVEAQSNVSTTNNYGVFINAPSGATGENLGLKNLGGASVNAAGTALGFYGATPSTRLSVAGSRAGNAALTSLLTQLAALGLIVDGSSV
jgi:hypothetical protein